MDPCSDGVLRPDLSLTLPWITPPGTIAWLGCNGLSGVVRERVVSQGAGASQASASGGCLGGHEGALLGAILPHSDALVAMETDSLRMVRNPPVSPLIQPANWYQ